MQTEVLSFSENAVEIAARLLQQDEVVAIPTETVYGLAANAKSSTAVRRIFEAKGRPQDNPLIAHIADRAMLRQVASEVPDTAAKLAEAFWPGPLTMVLPRSALLAPEVSAGLGTVGVRMPAHPAALSVIEAAGFPLAAPSANLSGTPSPTCAAHVYADMAGRIPLILDGGECAVGIESTVVSLVAQPRILRPGFVTKRELEEVLGADVLLAPALTQPMEEGESPASPGMKYRHYSPKAQVILVEGGFSSFAEYVAKNAQNGVFALCFEGEEARLPVPAVHYGRKGNEASQAAGLFSALRLLDEKGAQTVYARYEANGGIGFAVYNRLLRAAGFRVMRL